MGSDSVGATAAAAWPAAPAAVGCAFVTESSRLEAPDDEADVAAAAPWAWALCAAIEADVVSELAAAGGETPATEALEATVCRVVGP